MTTDYKTTDNPWVGSSAAFVEAVEAGVTECAIEQRRRYDLAFIDSFKELQAPSNQYVFGAAAALTEKKLKTFVKVTQERLMRELFVDSITQTSFYERGWEWCKTLQVAIYLFVFTLLIYFLLLVATSSK